MDLDTFVPSESPETWSNSAEVSERLKEAIKRWAAGVKRTKKDEKKAKRNDILLAGFLVKIIIDKKYDSLLDSLFWCLNIWFWSNILLWILSLNHEEISEKIRTYSWKEYTIFNFKYENAVTFNDASVNDKVKQRINSWVEDISDIISIDYSHIQIWELKHQLISQNVKITDFTKKVLIFFLSDINITIWESQAEWIAEFVISEIQGNLKKLPLEEI